MTQNVGKIESTLKEWFQLDAQKNIPGHWHRFYVEPEIILELDEAFREENGFSVLNDVQIQRIKFFVKALDTAQKMDVLLFAAEDLVISGR